MLTTLVFVLTMLGGKLKSGICFYDQSITSWYLNDVNKTRYLHEVSASESEYNTF